MKTFNKILDVVEKILNILMFVTLSAIVLVMFYQALMRYAFNRAPAWAEELAVYICCYSTMLGAALAVRKANHLQVDFIIMMLSEKAQKIISIIINIALAVFFVLIAKYAISLCEHATGVSPTMPFIVMKYIYYSFPISSVLIIIFAIENILNTALSMKDGKNGRGEVAAE